MTGIVEVRDMLGVDSWRALLVPSNRRSASTDTHAIRIVYPDVTASSHEPSRAPVGPGKGWDGRRGLSGRA